MKARTILELILSCMFFFFGKESLFGLVYVYKYVGTANLLVQKFTLELNSFYLLPLS